MNNSDRARQQRSVSQLVHIVVVHGPAHSLTRNVSIPLYQNDLAKTYKDAVNREPLLLNGWIRHVVVIHGDEVHQYDPPRFRWLCGVGPEPDNKDPDWMGA